MVFYLPGCASITLAAPTATCNGDRLLGCLSSSSSTSKAAGDLKSSETLLLSSNLCGLVTIMALSRSSSFCDSCDDRTLSSRKNLQRALQKNNCCCRCLYPSSIASDMKIWSLLQATDYIDAHTSSLRDVYTTPRSLPELEEPEATLTCYFSAKT